MATAPYLSSALEQGFSLISGQGSGSPAGTYTTSTAQCSSVVSVKNLVAPDISGGSADVAYPSDYCALASYALQLVNADRSANGTGPVVLGYNQAAQQHADSMLYYGYFSHNDTQGYKPYMRYTLLGGRGADFENIGSYSYTLPHFTSTSAVEDGIRQLEESMVYHDNDSIGCYCNNGHRYNILSPLHNVVSIGVAYDGTNLYFDEEFENDYVALNITVTSGSAPNPYYVTMTGPVLQRVAAPDAIYIAFDQTPAAETTAQLNSGPHEYGPGALIGGALPTNFFGGCGQFTSGTTVCADTWKFSTSMDIAFSLSQFVKTYGHGVYTIYLVTGLSTNSALTTISVFVQ